MFKLLAVSILSVLPRALAGNIVIHNQCTFAMWCGAAKNDGTFTPSLQVVPGQSYLSPKPAGNRENIGVVVKCGMDAHLLQPWQVEMNVATDGVTYLDLSSIDGSPFLAYHRHAEIPGTTCVIDCPPWTSDCDYPYNVVCHSQGDLSVTIC
ncbi:hypothetical protein GGR50DRAFT_692562 [Xylaria sp. CBS 124048]|nr:hypothetical protein GGR50DRAFT_692562 [Xylaria sp. CBS 124048]